jgi:hypothetical protein
VLPAHSYAKTVIDTIQNEEHRVRRQPPESHEAKSNPELFREQPARPVLVFSNSRCHIAEARPSLSNLLPRQVKSKLAALETPDNPVFAFHVGYHYQSPRWCFHQKVVLQSDRHTVQNMT